MLRHKPSCYDLNSHTADTWSRGYPEHDNAVMLDVIKHVEPVIESRGFRSKTEATSDNPANVWQVLSINIPGGSDC